MSSEMYEADEKFLNVLYRNRRNKFVGQQNIDDKIKIRRPYKPVVIDTEPLKNHVAKIREEFKRASEVKRIVLANIGMSVKANERQNIITDKFVGDVERLVTRFKSEFGKIQELFGNIIQKLPQLDTERNVG